ncbi:MAG TPA: Snf7 family protein [Candidatus Nitrosotalea sp.]|uniref:Snf7 family protein n=1 Tax=Candidatus Nitrosotalea sp. FS TaxID=2341021 RepID=UPI001409DB5F|nr:Snf7 family protein [Candidatus Nitrosotalea sp. FS]NHH98974.1 Archaeal ESCORT-III [Candidatus Nitrosotalea sp. FS]HEU5221240.1 Snf7 family protein [Candidatus Nitrosotalea sp.]
MNFTNKWNVQKESISQRVIDKVKPDAPLKPKIDEAQKKLQLQIIKLDSISKKLKEKDDFIFKKVVEAVKTHNKAYSNAYATELNEIRKMNNMVTGAKLAMEQIQLRLNTISELGDVVVTLSPCMSIIKGLGAGLNGLMPAADSSMSDLSNILGEIMSGASVSGDNSFVTETSNSETNQILEEAHAILEGHVRQNIPDLPPTLGSTTKAPEPI